MTREEAKHWLEIELKTWEDECKSKHPIKEALSVAIKALVQEPMLDKIRADILEEMLSHSGTGEEVIQAYADGLKKGLEFIDKYKAESEG